MVAPHLDHSLLCVQVAGLQRELADARREAAKVEAARAEALRERDEAVGEAGGLRTQRDVLAAQVGGRALSCPLPLTCCLLLFLDLKSVTNKDTSCIRIASR